MTPTDEYERAERQGRRVARLADVTAVVAAVLGALAVGFEARRRAVLRALVDVELRTTAAAPDVVEASVVDETPAPADRTG